MKIAIIAGTFFPLSGGVQVEIHNMANKLVQKGHSVDVYVYKNVDLKNNLYKIVPINYIFLSLLYILKRFLNFKLEKIFNIFDFRFIKLNYEIYHFHFLNFKSLILIEFLNYYKKKILVTFHGADIQIKKEINYGFRINKEFNFYLNKLLKNISGIQCISSNIYKDLIKLGINKKIIYKIPNSIYLNKKNYKKNDNDHFHLITVGRFAKKKKGFDLIPKIAQKLIEKKIKFKWKIIGKNSQKIYEDKFLLENKDKIISIENIENKKEFFFPASKLLKHYYKANLYINLARIESFGLTYIECLSCNTPILSFYSKGIDEILENKKNGLFAKNIDDLVNKIYYLNSNRRYLKKISNNCRKTIYKYNIDKNYLKLINFYKKFLN